MEPPPLIPREILFGNPERTAPQLSPEGTQISWLAPAENGVLNVWDRAEPWKKIEGATAEVGESFGRTV